MEGFLLRALAGGAGVALVAGPLGCFIVWRRMAYFGAAVSHGALLGVAVGLFFGVGVSVGVAGVCLLLAGVLALLHRQRTLAADTILGILAHAALAAGLIALGFIEGERVDLLAYLFGDVLSVGPGDLAGIYGGGTVVLACLAWIWRPLLAITVDEELARAEGVAVGWVRLILMLLVALSVAIAMKIVGVLLIVSLLIIPPASARAFARSPEAMAAIAAGLGVLAVIGGLAASLAWDTPAGPSIVAAATVLFVLCQVTSRLTNLFSWRSGL
ncbi:MAG: iron chelate uptake ABC transporter family permease subunit [Alphaproteobacteria bacterium]